MIPSNITAGDTLSFSEVVANYAPADGWALTYEIVNATNNYSILSTDNGDGSHLVAETAANTATYAPGDYRWQSFVTKSAERFTINSGAITIKRNFATGEYDGRSHVKKTLDAIEAMIEGRASKDVASYSVQGRSLSRLSPEELITFHSRYEILYRREQDSERVSQGLATGRKILTRFV